MISGHGHGGSPPHAWGIPVLTCRSGDPERFTPTRVGNTSSERCRGSNTSVHPHTRGEYVALMVGSTWALGSPPHAWGILPLAHAHRGKTGSPPHAWGIQFPNSEDGGKERF